MPKVKTVAVAAWIAALSAWVVYEQTLADQPEPVPPPPAAPPPPEPGLGGAPVRDVLWMQGVDVSGGLVPALNPPLTAIASCDRATGRHHLEFRGAAAASFELGGARIAHGLRVADFTGDGRPEIAVPVWNGGWQLYAFDGAAIAPIDSRVEGCYPARLRDADGDGTTDWVAWQTSVDPPRERVRVWDAAARRFRDRLQ
jgi:hypothetical protein